MMNSLEQKELQISARYARARRVIIVGGTTLGIIRPKKAFPQMCSTSGVAGMLLISTGCSTPTTMRLSGSPGAQFSGHYTRQGHDVEVAGTVPRTFKARSEEHTSELQS